MYSDAMARPRLGISQSALIPPRPEVLGIRVPGVEAALVDTQHLHAHADTGRTVVLVPYRDSNGVVAAVVENAREDRELDLVADVWEELACKKDSQYSHSRHLAYSW